MFITTIVNIWLTNSVEIFITERQTLRTKSPQVLMTECPLKTRHFMQFNFTKYLYHIFRCVSRNFCDNNGMVTSSKHNDFAFEDDKRGFIVSQTNKGGNFTLTISTPGLRGQLEECAGRLLCGSGDSALWPGPASQTGRCLQSKLNCQALSPNP